MTKDFWVNLPVKDIQKAKEFFIAIGFSLNPGPGNSDVSASVTIGNKNVIIMFFEENLFRSFTGNNLPDTKQANEVLFSLSAESREEVDEWANKVKAAGGNVFSQPNESQGWMYGCAFADLDGHRWNILYMDLTMMPKAN